MKSKYLFLIIFAMLLNIVICSSSLHAATTTYYKASSPYSISANTTISSGDSLIIEAGVVVNYTGNFRILVNGTLTALGTITDSIVFKHQTPGSSHEGIDFISTSTISKMEYCRIQDGGNIITTSRGGGILIQNSDPIIRHCLIKNNEAEYGGGIIIYQNSSATIESNRITKNTANSLGGGIGCDGINATYTNTPVIRNNIFYDNQSNYRGGGLSFNNNTTAVLVNNIFYADTATHISDEGGGLIIQGTGNVITVRNCIFWNNSPDQLSGGSPIVEYSDIQGWTGGTGNINSDPNFIDASNYDFHIDETSPCIDAGISTGTPSVDADSNATAQDGNNTSDTYENDMGAFEFLQDSLRYTSGTSQDFIVNTFESGASNTIATITLNGYSSGSGDIIVNCFTKSNPPNAPAGSKSVKRWYRISETGSLSYTNANLRLYYSDGKENLDNLTTANITLWRYNGSTWINMSGSVTTGSNWVQLAGVSPTNLSGDWAFSDPSDSPLPIQLISFTAQGEDKKIKLEWNTASELENLGFIIERSTEEKDGYYEIDSYIDNYILKGAGNSSVQNDYEYIDFDVMNGQKYWYKVFDVSLNGIRTEHGPVYAIPNKNNLHIVSETLPLTFDLKQNYPNPFNPSTTIGFDIPANENELQSLSIIVYDLLGRKIKTLYGNNILPGSYEIEWNGLNETNQTAPSGVYIYQIIVSNGYNKSQKMVLLR